MGTAKIFIYLQEFIEEVLDDIHDYVHRQGFFRRIMALLSRLWSTPVPELSSDERRVLTKATLKKGAHSIIDIFDYGNDIFFNELEPLMNVAKKLVERGLFESDEYERFWLTRAGWKRAVVLMGGRYDKQAGLTIGP